MQLAKDDPTNEEITDLLLEFAAAARDSEDRGKSGRERIMRAIYASKLNLGSVLVLLASAMATLIVDSPLDSDRTIAALSLMLRQMCVRAVLLGSKEETKH